MRRILFIARCRYLVYFLFLLGTPSAFSQLTGESPSGLEKLHDVATSQARTLVSSQARPLLSPADQESFLKELEGEIPDWSLLHDQPNEELGERLFAFNRQRDQAREGHVLLTQKIAFLWSGLLRQYVAEQQGFTIALGPELTETTWGIVRFKPVGFPQEMIAIPSPEFRRSLQQKLVQGEKIEIKILFTGRLIPDESIIYAFSHEDPKRGMIIPVVQIEKVQYFFDRSE